MRYWLYKCNVGGGPAGYWGDWRKHVFASRKKEIEWGGDYSTESHEVHRYLSDCIAKDDVIVAYQTDERMVVGFCVVTRMQGAPGSRKIWLAPLHELSPGFPIHDHKRGTPLERSHAVRGPVMMRELERAEMESLVKLAGAPSSVMKGQAATPRKASRAKL